MCARPPGLPFWRGETWKYLSARSKIWLSARVRKFGRVLSLCKVHTYVCNLFPRSTSKPLRCHVRRKEEEKGKECCHGERDSPEWHPRIQRRSFVTAFEGESRIIIKLRERFKRYQRCIVLIHDVLLLLITKLNNDNDTNSFAGWKQETWVGVHTGTTVPWGYRYNGEKNRC